MSHLAEGRAVPDTAALAGYLEACTKELVLVRLQVQDIVIACLYIFIISIDLSGLGVVVSNRGQAAIFAPILYTAGAIAGAFAVRAGHLMWRGWFVFFPFYRGV